MKKQVKEYLENLAQSDDKKTKEEFLNIIMRQLFCMPTEPEVFEKLPPEVRKGFSQDARLLIQLPLWKKLIEEMKYLSHERMFSKSTNWDEVLGGKFMLFTLDVIEKKIEKLSKM